MTSLVNLLEYKFCKWFNLYW